MYNVNREFTKEQKLYHEKQILQKQKRQQEIIAKIALVLFAVCLIIGISVSYKLVSYRNASQNEKTDQYKYYKSVMVSSGETLWSLASENYSDGYENIDDYIYEVKEINHLNSDALIRSGQYLILPYYSQEYK